MTERKARAEADPPPVAKDDKPISLFWDLER
jgi:hypothetical protein